jgi:hypothetical protein
VLRFPPAGSVESLVLHVVNAAAFIVACAGWATAPLFRAAWIGVGVLRRAPRPGHVAPPPRGAGSG